MLAYALDESRMTYGAPRRAPVPRLAKNQLQISLRDFRSAAVVALKSILGLLRIAKWKADLCQGKNPNSNARSSQARARFPQGSDEYLLESLYSVADEAFSTPEHAGLRELAHSVILQLLTATTTSAVVWALDNAARLYATALPALRGKDRDFNLFSVTSPSLLEASGSYFAFAVFQRPDSLLLSWPMECGASFFEASATVSRSLRYHKSDPSFIDFVALHLGYQLLAEDDSQPAVPFATKGAAKVPNSLDLAQTWPQSGPDSASTSPSSSPPAW